MPRMCRPVNEPPLEAVVLDHFLPVMIHLQFDSKAPGKGEFTSLKGDRPILFPAAKWKHQACPPLIGHMIVCIMAPWGERQVREVASRRSPGSLTTDYCNRLKVT